MLVMRDEDLIISEAFAFWAKNGSAKPENRLRVGKN